MYTRGNLAKVPKSFLLQIRLKYIKKVELYSHCYAVLGVEEKSDQNTIRKAYIELVKKVHPDSGHPDASADRFHEVDNAFRVLQEKFAKNRRGIDDDEQKVFDIRHTAPQHRQYLSFDGVGLGTPFQRQKQYQQDKAMKAQERVLAHRVNKAQAGESSLMKKGTHFQTHAIKTKYGFDRVVEDLIQEAISKGDFDHLQGTGKPISNTQSQNPYLDFTTHKLNKILLDNGFTPEWIQTQREIREEIEAIKKRLIEERSYLGDAPLDDTESTKWELIVGSFQSDVELINKKIDKYNLIVPILENQMVWIKLSRMAEKILNDETLPRNQERNRNVDSKNSFKEETNSSFLSFLGSLF